MSVGPTASALGFDTEQECAAFADVVRRLQNRDSAAGSYPLRIFEHKGGSEYSLHTSDDIATASGLALIDGLPEPLTDNCIAARLSARSVRDLVRHAMTVGGRKVEIYVRPQAGPASATSRRAAASPGTLLGSELEDEFFGGDASDAADGGVLAVRFGAGKEMGLAHLDLSRMGNKPVLYVAQEKDDDSFSVFEGLVVATGAREVIMCPNDPLTDHDKKKIQNILKDLGVACTDLKRKDFDASDIEQDLYWLTSASRPLVWLTELKLGLSAVRAAIHFTKIMSNVALEGRLSISQMNQKDVMQLDSAATRALNVFPHPSDGGLKTASLYGLLNKTKTPMGARELKRWLSRPLQDIQQINDRLDLVEAFVRNPSMTGSARDDHLRKIPDLTAISRKFAKAVPTASLQDVVRLYQFSVRLPYMCSALIGDEVTEDDKKLLSFHFAQPLQVLSKELANFEALVETTIDFEALDNHEYVMSPNIDQRLAELSTSKDEIQNKISDCYAELQRTLKTNKADQLKIEKKDDGYCFRLTRKDEKLIRGQAKYQVIDTKKDGVRFVTKELRRLNNDYIEVMADYTSKQTELVKKTLEIVGTYIAVFEDCSSILAKIDVLTSFAICAVDAREAYCRPELRSAGLGINIVQGRHPMVEDNLDGRDFIANDIDLRRPESDGGRLAIVTGPNMGGKSTYIRMTAVITLMAHCGCWVPAQKAEIPITDRILARVGAGDDQLRGVSTFMAEMLETAAILRSATSKSLVVIDELGRGTSTYDGYGLAYGIAEHLAVKTGCACLFATHFHELTALETDLQPGLVKNLHVSATTGSDQKLVFLYGVKDGACDQSFGIHVAELVGFPARVLENAKRKASELEDFGSVSDERLAKVPKADQEAGQEMIATFLTRVKELKSQRIPDSEIIRRIQNLRESCIDNSNLLIQAISTKS